MPSENILLLALIIFAFGIFALALAYGSAVAGGSKNEPQNSDRPRSKQTKLA